MPRDLDLKRRLELAGLIVTEIDGWQERGSSTFNPRGSVNHHTAGPRIGVQPSLGTCINGRGGPNPVPGPLCNVHGPREESLRVHLVAAGRANHAGRGGFRGLSGNSSVWGLEEEHIGYASEPISELRLDRMARVHAAFLFGTADASWCCQHWEWTPRKIDFVKGMLDPDAFRQRVARHLAMMAGVVAPPPTPSPIALDPGDTAMLIFRESHPRGWVWACRFDIGTRRYLGRPELDLIVENGGVVHQDPKAKAGWQPPVAEHALLQELTVVGDTPEGPAKFTVAVPV